MVSTELWEMRRWAIFYLQTSEVLGTALIESRKSLGVRYSGRARNSPNGGKQPFSKRPGTLPSTRLQRDLRAVSQRIDHRPPRV